MYHLLNSENRILVINNRLTLLVLINSFIARFSQNFVFMTDFHILNHKIANLMATTLSNGEVRSVTIFECVRSTMKEESVPRTSLFVATHPGTQYRDGHMEDCIC